MGGYSSYIFGRKKAEAEFDFNTGLVADWNLNETSDKTIYDSAKSHHLTHVDDLSLLTTDMAKEGTALNFNGRVSAYGTLTEDLQLRKDDTNRKMTISFWYQPINAGALQIFFGFDTNWEVYVVNNLMRLRVFNEDGTNALMDSTAGYHGFNNVWVHTIVTFDPSEPEFGKIYINGQPVGVSYTRTPGILRTVDGSFTLGGWARNNDIRCPGIMDLSKIWMDRSFTDEEALQLYNSEK